MIFGMVTTCGSAEFTPLALQSFFERTALLPNDTFFLIDNDGAAKPEWLRGNRAASLLVNSEPLSFAANVNQLLKRAHAVGEDLIFLNNDLIFTANWCAPLRESSPCLLSPLSNIEAPAATADVAFSNVVPRADYLTHPAAVEEIADRFRASPRKHLEVMSLPFFCIKIPYSIYSQVGPLDTRFGRGGAEDNDYCLRTLLRGFRIRYTTTSWVLHFNGRSTWGIESAEQQTQRQRHFTEQFCGKWGRSLTDLIIHRTLRVQEDAKLRELANQGAFAEIIRCLAQRDGILLQEESYAGSGHW